MRPASLITVLRWQALARRWLIMMSQLMMLVLACVSSNVASEEVDREYKLKAVYLLHFANFIDWPASAFSVSSNMNVCTFQNNPFGRYLNELEAKQVNGKVLTIRKGVAMAQITECHILFVGRSFNSMLVDIKKRLGSASVLLVSEQQDFDEPGGIISYFVDNNKLRIAIDAAAAVAADLKVSAKLLQIAKQISRQPVPAAPEATMTQGDNRQ